ncbi:hypothetical protein [Marinifilum caeruleilacunae]|uniref:YD repeat-containing protein n=1 Tax=Marinifilum caeruleilacunae TaxID=2499076 RepID=A0ABX1WYR8_9BACT|nr:hypothetical protein [Marinifilum caeruleilacunae]NOU61131.1 hypothetical protein [Marinifilum caeruleilacunae]
MRFKSNFCLKAIFAFFLIWSSVAACAQEIEGFQFVGSRQYAYNSKGERIEKRTFNAKGSLLSFVHYKYDENGNKIESLKYQSDSIIQKRYVYFYNLENQKVKSIKCDYIKGKESSKVYLHNSRGEISRTNYYSGGRLLQYTELLYSDKGELDSRKNFNKDGELTSENHFEYKYQNHRIIEKKKFSGADNLLSTTTYLFDKKGRKVSYSNSYVSSKRSNKKRFYQYNAKGQCVGSKVYEFISTKQ